MSLLVILAGAYLAVAYALWSFVVGVIGGLCR